MATKPIKVMVVDDTVVYRKVVSDVLSNTEGIEVVGVAANGSIAMRKLSHLKPDILTLDLEMPEMDGLEVLRELQRTGSNVGAIMLSAFTTQGANSTLEALKLGAFDFVLKPSGKDIDDSSEMLRNELVPKLKEYARQTLPHYADETKKDIADNKEIVLPKVETTGYVKSWVQPVRPMVIALGISTGGPQAFNKVLPELTKSLSVPLLIVQHMPPMFTASLANDLDRRCQCDVIEAYDGLVVKSTMVIIAPGGRQMKVVDENGLKVIRITDDPPENSCRPAVDYLFRSIAGEYGAKSLGVIMTGMGYDGTLGCKLMKRKGAVIITQDQASCTVYGMPKLLADEGVSDHIVSLDNMAKTIQDLVNLKGVTV